VERLERDRIDSDSSSADEGGKERDTEEGRAKKRAEECEMRKGKNFQG